MAEVKLGRSGLVAIVDDADLARVEAAGPWVVMRKPGGPYPIRNLYKRAKGETAYLARFIVGAKPGDFVKYRDRNRLNCTRDNLLVLSPKSDCKEIENPLFVSGGAL